MAADRTPPAQTALPLAGDETWVRYVDGEQIVRGGMFVILADGEIQFGTTGVVCYIPKMEHGAVWVLYEPVPMTEQQRTTLERLQNGWRPW